MRNSAVGRRANPSWLPYLALGVGVLALGFSAILVSWAAAPGAVTGFYRMLVAVLVLAFPLQRRLRRTGPVPGRELLIACVAGLLFAGDLIFWNSGVLISGAVNPTLMGNTAPVWVALGAWLFFRERLNGLFWAGLALALMGAAAILGQDARQGFEVGLGSLFGLVAGIFYGGYFLVTQRSRRALDALTAFWLAAASATLVCLAAALILRQPLTGYAMRTYLSFLGLGLLVQVVGQFAFSYALGYLPATLVSPAGLGQPVVTALFAAPLLHEKISPLEIVAGTAVLIGVYVVHRSRQIDAAAAPAGAQMPAEGRYPGT
ncbi:MAG: DMT family transporter [Candidatus Promineifilaceae bacterium]